jgi:hypothetical protein
MMERRKITVVCWKWRSAPGYRSKFEAVHVNTFARMIRRNYDGPMEIVCVTDDHRGIREVDRVVPLWSDFADIPSPHDRGRAPINPSCYRRLKMFSAEARETLGERIMSLDLDMVATGDLTPLFTRPEPIVLWGDTNPTTFYNGGMILHTAGARTQLWEEFKRDPQAAILRAQRARQFGSDQGWIGACLGPKEAKFSAEDGVFSYRNHLKPALGRLPAGARIVFFHGQHDPWGPEAQRLPWVREHWR